MNLILMEVIFFIILFVLVIRIFKIIKISNNDTNISIYKKQLEDNKRKVNDNNRMIDIIEDKIRYIKKQIK